MKKIKSISILFSILALNGTKAEQKKQPNFIVIFADDMGLTDVGAFHELYPNNTEEQLAHHYTPNLDRLAKEGIRCTRAYTAPWSAPSRQMLLTGQWVNRTNAFDHPWIGAQLRKEGYVTGLIGKSHGDRAIAKTYKDLNPKTAEFDDGFFFNGGNRRSYLKAGETFPTRKNLVPSRFLAKGGEYLTDVYTKYAVEFIEDHLKEPFMLYLPYNAPHGPLDGKPEDLRKLFPDVFKDAGDEEIMYGALSGPKGNNKANDNPESDRLEAMHFAAMVYRMDLSIGQVFETLKKNGLDKNTLIIFASDNGHTFGYGDWLAENHPFTGHKSDLFDGGIRTPFFVWSADIASSEKSGSLYNGLVSTTDIAPTLFGLANDKPNPYPTDGINIMPFLIGKKPQPKGRIYFCGLDGDASIMTGIESFSGKKYKKVMHSVFIKDDEKILCWNPHNTDEVGVVYTHIPDVVGKNNPAELVKENTPVLNIIPIDGRGKELYQELIKMIKDQKDELCPTWSGDDESDMNWWMIKK